MREYRMGEQMLERLDPDARAAVLRARDEATRSGKQEIGTEHLLLGLLERPGHAADALAAAGADPDDLRGQIGPGGGSAEGPAADAGSDAQTVSEPGAVHAAATAGRPAAHETGELPLTNHARRALELALQATHRFRHHSVSSGHLLLGIIDQPDNGGVQALRVAGIHVGTLRADVLQRLMTDRGPGAP
jgi:ATP-dependent Clp protease ATP-binding subunit ClpA